METVKIRGGFEHVKVLVTRTVVSVSHLMKEKPIAFYELVMKCRDRDHKLFGSAGAELRAMSLMSDDGSMHAAIKEIVLAATEGDGLDLKMRSPYEDAEANSPDATADSAQDEGHADEQNRPA